MRELSFFKRIGLAALSAAGVAALLGSAVMPAAASSGPAFNKHAQDDPTMWGRLYGTNSAYQTNVTANAGDVVVLFVNVHNSADPNVPGSNTNTAYNTRVKVSLPSEYSTAPMVARAKVSADNATTSDRYAEGAVTVSTTNGIASRMEYIPGSATLLRWDANANSFVETNFPDNTQRDKIVTDPNGYVIIPEQRACWDYAHYVRIQVRIVGGSPALQVLKQVSNGLGAQFTQSTTAIPSDEVQYQIEVKNTGTDTARGLMIGDSLDARHTYVAGSSKKRYRNDQGQIVEEAIADPSISGATHTWALGDLAATPNGNVFIMFKAKLKDQNSFPVGQSTIENCAAAAASNAANQTTAECTTVVVTRNGEATFVISKEVQRAGDVTWYGDNLNTALAPGQNIRYRITVYNQGTAAAQNVVLKDILPAGVTFSGTAQRWYRGGQTAVDASAMFTNGGLNIGTLNTGNTEAIAYTIDARVNEGPCTPGTLTNRAQIWFGGALKGEDNASASLTCTTGISVIKDVRVGAGAYVDEASEIVREGQELSYRITVANTGNSRVTDMYVRDVLPQFVQYIPGTLTLNGARVTDQNTVNAFFAQGGMKVNSFVEPGESYTIEFRVQIVDCPVLGRTRLVNTAYARALTLTEVADTAVATLEVRAPRF